jgi:phospholipid/cholesterol/gamma-HCH transport system substrate-binding protein
MRREIGWRRALASGLFALATLGLAGFAAMEVSRRHWTWQPTVLHQAEFPTVAGLEVGARVLVQGIDAGAVEAIVPPAVPGGTVRVRFRLDRGVQGLVRADATARIGTQGIVGAKVLEIVPGRPDAPDLLPGQPLRAERPRELSDLVADAATTLRKLDAVAEAARTGLGEINAIAARIRQGEGTLGRLVADDEAYRRVLSLTQRGESTLNDLSDNLAAMKQTWPLTRYFDRRGFEDIDRVLYQPGSTRERSVLAEADLFEPGRAVLTPGGRRHLDDFARSFKGRNRPSSTSIVIAAFTDSPLGGDEELARVLTQEQADAVKSYLTNRHKLQSNGWFAASRKVAAVGFGTHPPRTPDAAPGTAPARRVEIILFTPQA